MSTESVYKRILLIAPNWLGDAVMSLPTIKGLKSLFPESHLSVLVKSELQDIFHYEPDINEVIPLWRDERRGGIKRLSQDYKTIRQLRGKNFDLALILPRSFHSALIGFLSKIPHRIGYSADSRGKLLTRSLPRTKENLQQHRIYYFLNLLNILGRPVPSLTGLPPRRLGVGAFSAPRISIPQAERKWASDKLAHAIGSLSLPYNGSLQEGHSVIGLNPGATYGTAKCWLPERYAQLARELINKKKVWIILFGSPSEEKLNSSIAAQIARYQVLNFSGKTSITQMAALLSVCKVLVTNDTGTMHVSAAVKTPVVSLFGPTDHITTSPFGQNHTIIRKNVSCSPCLKRTCPTDHRCMKLISVEEVYKKVEKYL
ncbi:MAG: lipopolysaccharide heptosyltransferase II [Planctomycetota bacterium]|nr:lipopolysaccharide heptosyltransferase II [Planctomycetota bacterium]MDI6786949.1 lipopolysaccharide heptosyltransferase II [Planctomycetota bacterium]